MTTLTGHLVTRHRPSGEMPPTAVTVETGARLHLGMLSFGQPDVRRYGGVGFMIDAPVLRVSVSPASHFTVEGPAASRARLAAERTLAALGRTQSVDCLIRVETPLAQHAGLGTGTQLALAVVAGLHRYLGQDLPAPARLAQIAGRAARSAIGTYGFALGGLLVEGGKFADDEISPLCARVPLPSDWRFVLVRTRSVTGLSGLRERKAFGHLPPVPREITDRLCRLITDDLLPAVAERDFSRFSWAVHEYGFLAGSCFAPVQGGPFHGPRVAALVDRIRALGVVGVGQSSWGPTLFAALPHETAAVEFVARLAQSSDEEPLSTLIAAPRNHAASVSIHTES